MIWNVWNFLNFGEFEWVYPWISFESGFFFSMSFHKRIVEFYPQNSKKCWTFCKIAYFCQISWRVYQKMTKFLGKKRQHCFVWEEIMLFPGCILLKNSWVEKSVPNELVCIFSNSLPILANPSAHILDEVVLLCISPSVAQFHIIFWFLV